MIFMKNNVFGCLVLHEELSVKLNIWKQAESLIEDVFTTKKKSKVTLNEIDYLEKLS